MSYEGVHDAEAIVKKAKAMIHNKSNGPIPKCIKDLVYHERTKRIQFRRTGLAKSFVIDKNLSFNGISKRLKKTFWKHRIAPSASNSKSKTASKNAERKIPRNATGCYHGGSTAAHGRKVHTDFQRLVNAIRLPLNKSGGIPYVSKVDPCAYRLMNRMLMEGWVPVKSEFCIFDEHLRIATAVDCIAWDIKNRRGVLIEIKTGHEGQYNYESNDGKTKLLEPLTKIPDSPLNRAAVQLTVSLLMILRRYDIRFDTAAVIRPRSRTKDVQIYNIPKWILLPSLQCKMYARLKETVGLHTERRFFKRTANQVERSAFELQEAAQKAIEVGPDPKADVTWGLDSNKIIAKTFVKKQLSNSEMKIKQEYEDKHNTDTDTDKDIKEKSTEKSSLTDLIFLYNDCVSGSPLSISNYSSESSETNNNSDSDLPKFIIPFEKSGQKRKKYKMEANKYESTKNNLAGFEKNEVITFKDQKNKQKHTRKKKRVKITETDNSWNQELCKMGIEDIY